MLYKSLTTLIVFISVITALHYIEVNNKLTLHNKQQLESIKTIVNSFNRYKEISMPKAFCYPIIDGQVVDK